MRLTRYSVFLVVMSLVACISCLGFGERSQVVKGVSYLE